MKEDNRTNPPNIPPPHNLKYWIKGNLKDGKVIKIKSLINKD